MPKSSRDQWGTAWLGLGLAWELGWSIALPVVVFTLLGNYVDQQTGSDFVFRLLGGLVGIGLGVYLVYKKAEGIKKKIDEHSKKAKSND